MGTDYGQLVGMEDVSLPVGGEQSSRAWVAPLAYTVVTAVAGFFVLGVLGFSAMACDACTSEKARGFDASISTALMVLKVGFLVPARTLVVAWESRHAGRRAMLALMAPVAVVVLFVACMAMVEWP
ncbi:hypothetical protein [Streptomyces sp. cg2]|uniref:hypothetical protein n=1 Tax=Streptomyces sp. cg2 TaxID=3238799 RepID=UPI0034E301DF